MRFFLYIISVIILLSTSCTPDSVEFALFDDVSYVAPFYNKLTYTEEFNPYTYRNFYNGGGVALGDINNDGLLDIYFTGNQVDNKLYLNKGNWIFEDITNAAGVACKGVWSSGANFVDINGDGLLDIYVCKAGSPEGDRRYNELFINQGDLSFIEQSKEYGLDIKGLSIHSAFFDYDHDGDLDCYVLNNSLKSVGGFDLAKGQRNVPSENGNKFLENQNGMFIDVSTQAGIYTSAIGFGLGITLTDVNLDGWTDIYVSNDFYERDYLYINQHDKTFKEEALDYFESIPLGSMGADAGDINNDGYPDFMITEMLPRSQRRKKTKALYESWEKYNRAIAADYGHQFPRNMLQLHNGHSSFMEIGRSVGVDATDWSWSSLIQDFDNDGLKDIFVANGIGQDLLDRDYLSFYANDARVKNLIDTEENAIMSLIDSMPSSPLSNHMFNQKYDGSFLDKSKNWGLNELSYSNGCAYGDLDNDGDLDLVINNIKGPSFIYKNNSTEGNYIQLDIRNSSKNSRSIGAKVIVYACGQRYMTEQYPARGFQSCSSDILHVGLGSCSLIDSIELFWKGYQLTTQLGSEINQRLIVDLDKLVERPISSLTLQNFRWDTLNIKHKEYNFNQFNRERLIGRMNARKGPVMAFDNNDKLWVGGSKNIALKTEAQLSSLESLEEWSKASEHTDIHFFDSDNDGDQDIYMAYGGTGFTAYSPELRDQIWVNENGSYRRQPVFKNQEGTFATVAVDIADYDQDGLLDIIAVDGATNQYYGSKGSIYLLHNDGNNEFSKIHPSSIDTKAIWSDVRFVDLNEDDRLDILAIGEWTSPVCYLQKEDSFVKSDNALFTKVGVYNTIHIKDFNADGRDDIFLGARGLNSELNENSILVIGDFDQNGKTESLLCEKIDDKLYPVIDKDDLMSQFPSLKKRYTYYKEYAKATMIDLFGKKAMESFDKVEIENLKSQLFLSAGASEYISVDLPKEIQYSSIYAVQSTELNGDGIEDIIVGGNHYLVKPQFGRDDASRGWVIYSSKDSSNNIQYDYLKSLDLRGEIRDIEISQDNEIYIGINDGPIVKTNIENLKIKNE